MNILLLGEPANLEECRLKFGENHSYIFEPNHRDGERFIRGSDVVFDFIIDEDPKRIDLYIDRKDVRVFFNTSKISLRGLSYLSTQDIKTKIFGFNGLPTFVNRDVFEVSVFNQNDEAELKQVCDQLKTDYLIVDDRVGLVTPRIVCMIINEAYYTVQEGTATREDIDQAMKLGTNYPFGPFEWCARIGTRHVYELLEAVYKDTLDERYKICPLLKKEYLML